MNEHEKDHMFVECATFADDIKDKGLNDQSPWHFIDQPFFDEGYNTTVYPEQFNVTWSIDYMHKNLKAEKKNEDTGVTWALGDAFNMRLLIHYVGDMHQPLHTVSRFTKDFPHGDMGGNLFMLEEKEGVNELHALWDSTIYEYDQDLQQPLNETAWNTLGEISQKLRTEHKVDFFDDLDAPESEWASEGYKLAINTVYDSIEQNTLPSDEYVERAQKAVHIQLAKGGYRLANLLIDIFNKKSEDVPISEPIDELI